MKTIAEYRTDFESAVKTLDFPGGVLDPLYAPIVYGLSAGGKRIRPALLLMAADAFGNAADKALRPALGIETFHNFTLLHDDVMDRSDMRRGRPTVHKKYGENAAILSGDTMLTLATEWIAEVDNDKLRPVLDAFNNMAIKVYEGQALDMAFETADTVSLADYITMIECKTGALLGAAAYIGAIIGGASEKDASRLYEFGMNVGIAFQIQDDWLDTFGDPATFGKPIGGDINNSKKTYLYLSALESSPAMAEALRSAMKMAPGDSKVKTVTRLYEKIGVKELCSKAVAAYSSKAMAAVKATGISDEAKDAFRHLAEKLIGRKK